jgi:Rv0078B-related antitoxin
MPIDPRRIEAVDEEMARVLRGKSGAERLRIASEMFDSARRMLESHLRAEHPDWDERRVAEETSRRLSLAAE